jgi:hypothetical protein
MLISENASQYLLEEDDEEEWNTAVKRLDF